MVASDHVACHNVARSVTVRFASSASYAPTLEKAELLPPRPGDLASSSLRRPADVFLPSWDLGSPAAFYFAIVSLQRLGAVSQASQTSGAAATLYERHKRIHLNTEVESTQQGVLFPLWRKPLVGGAPPDSPRSTSWPRWQASGWERKKKHS